MTTNHAAPSAADLDAARLLLSRLGVSPADLLVASRDRAPAPTFAEYIPVVSAAVADGTRRVYGSYWNRILHHWGTRRLDEPTPSEIRQLAEHIKTHTVAVRQAKTRREPSGWGATELAKILCAWGELEDTADAEFAFVTDASLNSSGQKLFELIQAMRVRPDEAVLRQTAAMLGRDGVHLPSADVMRRVQILTRMGTTEQVLALAETRILNLLSRSRIVTLDDAANATNALFRRAA